MVLRVSNLKLKAATDAAGALRVASIRNKAAIENATSEIRVSSIRLKAAVRVLYPKRLPAIGLPPDDITISKAPYIRITSWR